MPIVSLKCILNDFNIQFNVFKNNPYKFQVSKFIEKGLFLISMDRSTRFARSIMKNEPEIMQKSLESHKIFIGSLWLSRLGFKIGIILSVKVQYDDSNLCK